MYLVVKRDWGYDEDYSRPLKVTNDISEWRSDTDYRIYEVLENGDLALRKDFDERGLEKGMAIFGWNNYKKITEKPDFVLDKFIQSKHDFCDPLEDPDIAKPFFEKYGFKYDAEEIWYALDCGYSFAEKVGDKVIFVGEYNDDWYNTELNHLGIVNLN